MNSKSSTSTKKNGQSADTGNAQTKDAAKETATQAKEATVQAKDKVVETADQIQHQAGKMAEGAKEQIAGAVDDAKETAASAANEQKQQVSNSLHGVADVLRSSSEEFHRRQDEMFAGYAETAADQVDQVASYLENRDVSDVWQGVKNFAHRQPELFIGGSLVAGFFMGRFLKSTQQKSQPSYAGAANSSFRSPRSNYRDVLPYAQDYRSQSASPSDSSPVRNDRDSKNQSMSTPYSQAEPDRPVPVVGKQTDWGVDYELTELGQPAPLKSDSPEYPDQSKAENLEPVHGQDTVDKKKGA